MQGSHCQALPHIVKMTNIPKHCQTISHVPKYTRTSPDIEKLNNSKLTIKHKIENNTYGLDLSGFHSALKTKSETILGVGDALRSSRASALGLDAIRSFNARRRAWWWTGCVLRTLARVEGDALRSTRAGWTHCLLRALGRVGVDTMRSTHAGRVAFYVLRSTRARSRGSGRVAFYARRRSRE